MNSQSKKTLFITAPPRPRESPEVVLASEIYGIVKGVDIAIAINTTIKIITKQLGFPQTPIVVCTDSYSLYKCLVKLGTTQEKRLIIDIIALRQSYERRKITEIR
jgi:hypothetical protein